MPAYGGLASIDIGFSANSFHSEVISSLFHCQPPLREARQSRFRGVKKNKIAAPTQLAMTAEVVIASPTKEYLRISFLSYD